jgi:hypothetical protein
MEPPSITDPDAVVLIVGVAATTKVVAAELLLSGLLSGELVETLASFV